MFIAKPPIENKGKTFKGRHKRFVKRNSNIDNKNVKSFYSFRNGKLKNTKTKKNKNFINRSAIKNEEKILKELLPGRKKTHEQSMLVTKKSIKNIKKEVNKYFLNKKE